MMNWRKMSAAVLATVFAASALAGCGTKKAETPATPGAPAEPVTLEFWAHWASEQRRPTIDKIIKTWNDSHPNIQVKYTPVPFDQIITKTVAGVAAKNPPDVVVLDTFTTQARASKKQSTDLSQFGADELKSQFFDAPWSAVTYEGKAYGLPFVTDTRMLFYNKTLFKEVGLDPEKAPVSWEDLWAAADKLDKIENGKLTRVGFHPESGSAGADMWVDNGYGAWFDEKGTPTINSAKNLETIEWIDKWNERYGANNWSAFKASFQGGANDPFITGQLAMVVNVINFPVQIKKYAPNMEWGMVPVPTPDGKQHPKAAYAGGFNIEVPANAKHAKESYEFAKYFVTEAALVWGNEQMDLPAHKASAEKLTDPNFKLGMANMANTHFAVRPLTAPDYPSATKKIQEDLLAGMEPKAALDVAQKTVENMIKENTGK